MTQNIRAMPNEKTGISAQVFGPTSLVFGVERVTPETPGPAYVTHHLLDRMKTASDIHRDKLGFAIAGGKGNMTLE